MRRFGPDASAMAAMRAHEAVLFHGSERSASARVFTIRLSSFFHPMRHASGGSGFS